MLVISVAVRHFFFFFFFFFFQLHFHSRMPSLVKGMVKFHTAASDAPIPVAERSMTTADSSTPPEAALTPTMPGFDAKTWNRWVSGQ